jgi:hypothetical protein
MSERMSVSVKHFTADEGVAVKITEREKLTVDGTFFVVFFTFILTFPSAALEATSSRIRCQSV